jgi:hypothetical protein
MTRKRIGELLLERGTISRAQLDAGLKAQQRTRQKLGLTLIQQGFLKEPQLAQALGESLQLPVVDLSAAPVDWGAVHMLRTRFCETNELFPYAIEGKATATKRIAVAMSDPTNHAAIAEIGFTTGLSVSVAVATYSQVREAILRYYHKVSAEEARQKSAFPSGSVSLMDDVGPHELEEEVLMGEEVVSQLNTLPAPAAPTPASNAELVKLIDQRSLAARRRPGNSAVSSDLDFLFGAQGDEGTEKLEKKFWALLRIMARKGLITREEFLQEVEGED